MGRAYYEVNKNNRRKQEKVDVFVGSIFFEKPVFYRSGV
jgi:hypothetical protein